MRSDLTHSLIPRLALGLAAALLVGSSALAQDDAKEFRAGAATSNVSPELGHSINGNMRDVKARHINDEIHARCLVLDDGANRHAFVVVDSCMIPLEVISEAKAIIQEQSQLAPEHVTISATHAHSAPSATSVFQSDPTPEYQQFLARRIADGVQRAINNLAPAQIGWGVGSVPDQVFNRRWHMKPGTVLNDPFGGTTDKVKMNPGIGNPALDKPAGPIDPEVSVLAVRSPEGQPIALLANYSLHYVGGVGPGHVSADYFGAFAERVKQLLEADYQSPPFVAMMSNGTSGDINNVNFREARQSRGPYGQIQKVADDLAKEAVRVAREIEYRDHAKLDARTRVLQLGVRKPDSEELARAEEILSKAEGPVLQGLEEVYARETVLIDKYPDTVPVTIQAVRVGDLGIAAIPCEVFVEIGLELKEKSPFQPTFTIELANGYNGYLPTKEHHDLGGYETWRARSSYLEVDAARQITDTVFELFGELDQARK